MFNKDYNKNIFKGKPKMNKSLKPSPYSCNECGNALMFKGKTHLTCNCSDCPCFGESIAVNDVGPPPNCSSVLRYRLNENGNTGVYFGIDTINAVGQSANINITASLGSTTTLDIQLFDIAGASGNITVTDIEIEGNGVGNIDSIIPTPSTFSNGSSQILTTIRLNTGSVGLYKVGVTVETDCGDIYVLFVLQVV